jgi:hypothetical protein
MKTQIACGRKLGIAASATILAMTLALAGCASNGTRGDANGTSAASANAGAEAEARCRAAIADVTKMCADDSSSSRCNDAKARSRAACI